MQYQQLHSRQAPKLGGYRQPRAQWLLGAVLSRRFAGWGKAGSDLGAAACGNAGIGIPSIRALCAAVLFGSASESAPFSIQIYMGELPSQSAFPET